MQIKKCSPLVPSLRVLSSVRLNNLNNLQFPTTHTEGKEGNSSIAVYLQGPQKPLIQCITSFFFGYSKIILHLKQAFIYCIPVPNRDGGAG